MPSKKQPATKGKRRILIVDDHAILRYGLAKLINQEDDLSVCAEASDSSAALDIVARDRPDLAIVDISLNGRSGLELIKAMHSINPHLPVLVLSMHDERVYAERALLAGAMGYMRKHEATENLIMAIRKVLAGELYVSELVGAAMLRRLVGRNTSESADDIQSLSNRELEIFQLMGRGRGTRQIAEQLQLSIKTVETHRAHIKDKLKTQSSAELMRFAVEWVQRETAGDQNNSKTSTGSSTLKPGAGRRHRSNG